MKKAIALTAALLLLVGCTGTASSSSAPAAPSAPASVGAPASSQAAASHRLGLGVTASVKNSTAATADAKGSAAAVVTACAVELDSAGKIVNVRFDVVEPSVAFDMSGALSGDLGAEIQTRRELADGYALGAGSSAGGGWYTQADAFQSWMLGRTVTEVSALKTYQRDEQNPMVPDVDALRSSVTIDVGDMLEALRRAAADAGVEY